MLDAELGSNNSYSVHQGSVLSPHLFKLVLKAVSHKFHTGCPWELLHADNLVVTYETLDGLKTRLRCWKAEMEAKGLCVNCVNCVKTKIMVHGSTLHLLKDLNIFRVVCVALVLATIQSTMAAVFSGCTKNPVVSEAYMHRIRA